MASLEELKNQEEAQRQLRYKKGMQFLQSTNVLPEMENLSRKLGGRVLIGSDSNGEVSAENKKPRTYVRWFSKTGQA